MSDAPAAPAAEDLSPVKRALLEIRDLRARLAEAQAAASEPIALVGTGLRLPAGIRSMTSLWEFLARGGDAIAGIPRERWDLQALYDADPDAPGKMITREGAFIDEVDRFDAEFFGIVFRAGSYMPLFPVNMVMDRRDLNLPTWSGKSFWLNSSAWQIPDFDNADTFVQRLVRQGLLVADPMVEIALHEQPHVQSRRTIQRRFLRATGLTHNAFSQIQRARYATTLLKQGRSILDTVELAGYSDQPHMTRALKLLIGQTPAQIAAKRVTAPLSFLFKTLPF